MDALFSITVPFGTGGAQEEIAQGKVLAGVAAAQDAHLVYSPVAGALHSLEDASVFSQKLY